MSVFPGIVMPVKARIHPCLAFGEQERMDSLLRGNDGEIGSVAVACDPGGQTLCFRAMRLRIGQR